MPTITKAKAKQLGYKKVELQTILFNKHKFSKTEISKWLSLHKYKKNFIRPTENF